MTSTPRQHHPRRASGSIVIIVLITMAFAAAALVLFMEKAAGDLLVEARAADASRMRVEAYSAMETTLAILEDFRAALGGLHSPAEGWGDPLYFAGYEPIDPDYTIEIAFEDESGKLSLPNTDATTLTNLFKYWELDETTAAKLADALLGWMRPDYIPATAGAPLPEDYDTGDLPFTPPARTLRSFAELASIDFARDIFFDEDRRPNELYNRFVQTFSLYEFQTPNINAAAPDILGALGNLDPDLDRKLADYLGGSDGRTADGSAGYFVNKDEVNNLLGAGTPATRLGVTISALRVIVTVRQGQAAYRLNALVSMPGSDGAKIPSGWAPQTATSGTGAASGNNNTGSSVTPGNQGSSRNANSGVTTRANATAGATQKNLNYPYTILELRENDQVPPPAPIIEETAEP